MVDNNFHVEKLACTEIKVHKQHNQIPSLF